MTYDPGYGTPAYRLWRTAVRYGMTVAEVHERIKQQNNICKICTRPISVDKFYVDHDPECCTSAAKKRTCGKCTRGLLCNRCNLLVGNIDNAIYDNVFEKALAYIGYAKNDPDYDPNKKLRD